MCARVLAPQPVYVHPCYVPRTHVSWVAILVSRRCWRQLLFVVEFPRFDWPAVNCSSCVFSPRLFSHVIWRLTCLIPGLSITVSLCAFCLMRCWIPSVVFCFLSSLSRICPLSLYISQSLSNRTPFGPTRLATRWGFLGSLTPLVFCFQLGSLTHRSPAFPDLSCPGISQSPLFPLPGPLVCFCCYPQTQNC